MSVVVLVGSGGWSDRGVGWWRRRWRACLRVAKEGRQRDCSLSARDTRQGRTTHTKTHTDAHTHTGTQTHRHAQTHTGTPRHTHRHTQTHTHTQTRTRARAHSCQHTRAHTHTHTHTHTHRPHKHHAATITTAAPPVHQRTHHSAFVACGPRAARTRPRDDERRVGARGARWLR